MRKPQKLFAEMSNVRLVFMITKLAMTKLQQCEISGKMEGLKVRLICYFSIPMIRISWSFVLYCWPNIHSSALLTYILSLHVFDKGSLTILLKGVIHLQKRIHTLNIYRTEFKSLKYLYKKTQNLIIPDSENALFACERLITCVFCLIFSYYLPMRDDLKSKKVSCWVCYPDL